MLALTKSSISCCRDAAPRLRPKSSASLSRWCWSSRAALSGASETVRQSTFSKLGSFSASLRLALSALKLA